MTLQRGNGESAFTSGNGDAGDGVQAGLVRVAAAPQRVRSSLADGAADSRSYPIAGGGPPSVLLVDENALLVRSLARWFGRYGCAVTMAFTCGSAAALRGPFDCGVFDVEIGGGDGVALADCLLYGGTIRTAAFFCATNDADVLRRASELGPIVFKDRPMLQLITTVRAQIEVART
jgi:hypothetical protein